jgi:CheY-like chemotaxis protein
MKILVVDDERDIKDLFLQRFRKEIYNQEIEFEFAYSGEEALQYMNQHKHETVLILSDINMPGMTGLELLKRIKTDYISPSPTVMIITAYGDDDNKKLAKELGADGFMTKPINFTKLKGKIKIK